MLKIHSGGTRCQASLSLVCCLVFASFIIGHNKQAEAQNLRALLVSAAAGRSGSLRGPFIGRSERAIAIEGPTSGISQLDLIGIVHRMGPQGSLQLVRLLSSRDAIVRSESRYLIYYLAPDVTRTVRAMLNSDQPENVNNAIEAIDYLGPHVQSLVPSLRTLLKNPQIDRNQLLPVLYRADISNQKYYAYMVIKQYLQGGASSLYSVTADALKGLDHKGRLQIYKWAMTHPDQRVEVALARSLSRFSLFADTSIEQENIAVLRQLLSSPNAAVQRQAAESLVEYDEIQADDLLKVLPLVKYSISYDYMGGGGWIKAIAQHLKVQDSHQLESMLQNPTPDARANALLVLAITNPTWPGLFTYLESALKDKDPTVQAAAIDSLESLPHLPTDVAAKELAAALRPLLTGSDRLTFRTALLLSRLGMHDAEVGEELSKFLNSESSYQEREAAIKELSSFNTFTSEMAWDMLVGRNRGHETVNKQLMKLLSDKAGQLAPLILERVVTNARPTSSHEDSEVVREMVEGFGKQLIPILRLTLNSSKLFEASVQVFAMLAGDEDISKPDLLPLVSLLLSKVSGRPATLQRTTAYAVLAADPSSVSAREIVARDLDSEDEEEFRQALYTLRDKLPGLPKDLLLHRLSNEKLTAPTKVMVAGILFEMGERDDKVITILVENEIASPNNEELRNYFEKNPSAIVKHLKHLLSAGSDFVLFQFMVPLSKSIIPELVALTAWDDVKVKARALFLLLEAKALPQHLYPDAINLLLSKSEVSQIPQFTVVEALTALGDALVPIRSLLIDALSNVDSSDRVDLLAAMLKEMPDDDKLINLCVSLLSAEKNNLTYYDLDKLCKSSRVAGFRITKLALDQTNPKGLITALDYLSYSALPEVGQEALPRAIALCASKRLDIRRSAVRAVAHIAPNNEAVTKVLTEKLLDPSVTDLVLQHLEQSQNPSPTVLKQVASLLLDPDNRWQAVKVLAKYKQKAKSYVKDILPLLVENEDEVLPALSSITGQTSERLERLYLKKVEGFDQKVLADPSIALSASCFESASNESSASPTGRLSLSALLPLKSISHAEAVYRSLSTRRELKIEALQILKHQAFENDAYAAAEQIFIKLCLQDGESCDVRVAALAVLASSGALGHFAIERVIQLTKDSTPAIRNEAVQTLGVISLGSSQALKALIATSYSKVVSLRLASTYALGDAGSQAEAVRTRLRDLMKDSDSAVRLAAVEVCAQLELPAQEFLKPLINLLSDPDRGIKIAACDAIGGMGRSAAAAISRLELLGKSENLFLYADCAIERIRGNNRPIQYGTMIWRSAPPELTSIPPYSTMTPLQVAKLARPDKRIGDVYVSIMNALHKRGYHKSSLWAVLPDGFAIATDVERIQTDGVPATENRWVLGHIPMRQFSIRQYLQDLFYGTEDNFRLMLIVYTAQDIRPQGRELFVTEQGARQWIGGGGTVLPPSLAAKFIGPQRCFLLIYNFMRKGKGKSLVQTSDLDAVKQVMRTGLPLPTES